MCGENRSKNGELMEVVNVTTEDIKKKLQQKKRKSHYLTQLCVNKTNIKKIEHFMNITFHGNSCVVQ